MKTRVISGAVLAVIMISSLLVGGWYLYALCLGISLVGLFELYRVYGIDNKSIGVVGYLCTIVYYMFVSLGLEEYNMLIFVLGLLLVMTIYVITFPRFKTDQASIGFFGIFYVGVMLSYIYKVRMMEDGIFIVWLIFVSSWINDTCAYFTGVCFGKHKMAPVLSPKKSIEGAVGGILGATIIGFIIGLIVAPHMTGIKGGISVTFAEAGFAGAVFAIIGDLAASAIKRNHDVKDYGKLIPGHGGILDRFDSVIFTAPAVFWAVTLINMI